MTTLDYAKLFVARDNKFSEEVMNYFWYAISFKDSKELRETTN
jgi:hypothetical protein